MTKKILFLIPYPLDDSPSQRFRFEQYLEILDRNSFKVTIQSFLNFNNGRLFFRPGKAIHKTTALLVGFMRRIGIILTAPSFDYIFIHREVAPIGPPILEWVLARVLKKKIVYDFDDAIWLTDKVDESRLFKFAKWRSKVSYICRWSYKVSCGNDYLAAFAGKFNSNVVVNPTTVDTVNWHNPDLHHSSTEKIESLVIGWTGSHSTIKYLNEISPVLQRLEETFPYIQIMIIADQLPDLNLTSMVFVPWKKVSEVEDLMKIDIGIMPLPDNEWTKGKCGFKALQYMALGKPVVASDVGVNMQIIDNGVNGFLCSSKETWADTLTRLINDKKLCSQIGQCGRDKIVERYSVMSNTSKFLSLFE